MSGVSSISLGVHNAGAPGGGNLPDLIGHTYIAINWQNGGQTILEGGPGGATGTQLEQVNYGEQTGINQTASADNGWTGFGTVVLSFSSQDVMDQFAQSLISSYGNYDSNSATNPLYAASGATSNSLTYGALMIAGANAGDANADMQSLSSLSGLNLTGAYYDTDVVASMLNTTNNPQETFPTDPPDPQVDGGGTFTPDGSGVILETDGQGNVYADSGGVYGDGTPVEGPRP